MSFWTRMAGVYITERGREKGIDPPMSAAAQRSAELLSERARRFAALGPRGAQLVAAHVRAIWLGQQRAQPNRRALAHSVGRDRRLAVDLDRAHHAALG